MRRSDCFQNLRRLLHHYAGMLNVPSPKCVDRNHRMPFCEVCTDLDA